MRTQCKIVVISLITFMAALALAIVFEWNIDRLIITDFIPFLIGRREFIINILIGIVSSCLVTMLVSCSTYFSEKRRTLERFWSEVLKFCDKFNDYDHNIPIDERVDCLKKLTHNNLKELKIILLDVVFLFDFTRKNDKIVTDIYNRLVHVHNEIGKNNAYIEGLYNADKFDEQAVKDYIYEAEKLFYNITRENGFKLSYPKNKLQEEMYELLQNGLFRIIYGRVREHREKTKLLRENK